MLSESPSSLEQSDLDSLVCSLKCVKVVISCVNVVCMLLCMHCVDCSNM